MVPIKSNLSPVYQDVFCKIDQLSPNRVPHTTAAIDFRLSQEKPGLNNLRPSGWIQTQQYESCAWHDPLDLHLFRHSIQAGSDDITDATACSVVNSASTTLSPNKSSYSRQSIECRLSSSSGHAPHRLSSSIFPPVAPFNDQSIHSCVCRISPASCDTQLEKDYSLVSSALNYKSSNSGAIPKQPEKEGESVTVDILNKAPGLPQRRCQSGGKQETLNVDSHLNANLGLDIQSRRQEYLKDMMNQQGNDKERKATISSCNLEQGQEDNLINVQLLGAQGVGKTTLCHQIITSEFLGAKTDSCK
ncbi:unnamed protein product [Protopolystoma xenopodis]|uniref:Uncharacterized protein n=1 Tax=Protopolystoma xenopodis TaxID=117903 RepID=A0A3S5CJB5_9PLAT|nr:unnamed protein product [Protopolystoma xenopodis]